MMLWGIILRQSGAVAGKDMSRDTGIVWAGPQASDGKGTKSPFDFCIKPTRVNRRLDPMIDEPS